MLVFTAGCSASLYGQHAGKTDFKNGEFVIELNKHTSKASLEDFIVKYDLAELNLKYVLQKNQTDTLTKLGWKILVNDQQKLIITKPLLGSTNVNQINNQNALFAALFPPVSNTVAYGYNRFKNKAPFVIQHASVRFFLRKNREASRVMLAGSFNSWDPDALQMKKTDSGWIADVILKPGKYWYKFIIDGKWVIDNDNLLQENDGLGNTNSVFYFSNHEFILRDHLTAKDVYVAGSFNNWRQRELKMSKRSAGWILPLYLAEGTHRYKYIIDGRWITDPANDNLLPDGAGNYNSVLQLGKPVFFNLKGYTNARSVILTGSFNDWRQDELLMNKTATGWELSYTLSPGNYEYKFIVDGKWMTDPSNPLQVNNQEQTKNSILIVGANYTFRVRGFSDAKKIFLSGDFNNWSPDTFSMIHEGDEWIYKVHLSPGKHKYKLVVDDNWVTDPGNDAWEQNEYGTGNSVIWIEK
jgi:hypothetical protein